MRKLFLLVFVLFLLCSGELLAQGCSQCKLLSEQSTELGEDAFASNINYGILYLLILPYLLLMFLFRKRIISFFRSMLNR